MLIDLQSLPAASFETFVRGPGREDALELAKYFCSSQVGASYPFVVLSEGDTGKTFLLEAIQAEIHRLNPSTRVLWVRESLGEHKLCVVANAEVILIDTLQLNTEAPLLQIVNELVQRKKRVFMVGDLNVASEEWASILSLWPELRVAKLPWPTHEQKLEFGSWLAPKIKMKVINEIAHRSSGFRTLSGWLIHYDYCQKTGEIFSMDEPAKN